MHLNSWRAAGKKCRKRRPEGKMSHQVWMLHHVGLQNCIVQFFFCVWLYFSLRMAVHEDLEEEKREQEELKRKPKRKKLNWNSPKVRNEWMNEWEKVKTRESAAVNSSPASVLTSILWTAADKCDTNWTKTRVLFNKNLKICTSLLAMIWLKVFSFSMSLFIFPFWVQSLQHGCWGVFFFF